MGPLFSAFVALVLLSTGLLVAYVVFRPFTTVRGAALYSVVAVAGAVFGALLVAIVFAFIAGTDATLTKPWQVRLWFLSLALGSVGCATGAALVLRRRRAAS